MKVTVRFHLGILGELEIETDTEHGNPDVVKIDTVDFSHNGPLVDFLMLQLGESYQKALRNAERAKAIGVGA